MVKNLPIMQETQVWSLGLEDPLEEGLATHSSILAQRIPMDRGARWAAAHKIAHSWTWLKQLSMHAQLHSSEIFYYMASSYFRPQYKFLWNFKGRNEVAAIYWYPEDWGRVPITLAIWHVVTDVFSHLIGMGIIWTCSFSSPHSIFFFILWARIKNAICSSKRSQLHRA